MKDSDDGQVERRVDPEQRSDRAAGRGAFGAAVFARKLIAVKIGGHDHLLWFRRLGGFDFPVVLCDRV